MICIQMNNQAKISTKNLILMTLTKTKMFQTKLQPIKLTTRMTHNPK